MISAAHSSPTPSVDGAQGAQLQSCGASPEAQLLALMVYSQLAQRESAETTVQLNQHQLEELRRQVKEALEAAKEAGEDSGFWGSIGDALGGDVAALVDVVRPP